MSAESLLELRLPRRGSGPRTSGLTLGSLARAASDGLLGFLGIARSADRRDRERLIDDVKATRGFRALPSRDQSLVLAMLGDSSRLAVQQQGALRRMLPTQDWADMTDKQQKEELLKQVRPFKTKRGLEACKAWGVLGADVKNKLVARLNQPGYEHYADVVGRMVETQGFAGRDARSQAALLQRQLALTTEPPDPKDPGAAAALKMLQRQPAARGIDAPTRQRLDTLLAGESNPYAGKARVVLERRLHDPVYAIMTMSEKSEHLAEIAGGTTAAPKQIINLSTDRRAPARHSIRKAGAHEGYAFSGATRDATEHRVRVGARTIPVYSASGAAVPAQSTPKEIAQALATLPDAALAPIREVVINPVRNPQDAYWAKTFNMKGFRAAMTATKDGVIKIFPAAERARTPHTQAGYLCHEAGHLLAYDNFGRDVGGPGWRRYQEAVDSDSLVPSSYATGNINEDFAETMQLYLTSRDRPELAELRQLFPARFAVIEEVLGARGSSPSAGAGAGTGRQP